MYTLNAILEPSRIAKGRSSKRKKFQTERLSCVFSGCGEFISIPPIFGIHLFWFVDPAHPISYNNNSTPSTAYRPSARLKPVKRNNASSSAHASNNQPYLLCLLYLLYLLCHRCHPPSSPCKDLRSRCTLLACLTTPYPVTRSLLIFFMFGTFAFA